jgi:enoyl-CoA hydratase/carnithine racemase
MGCDLLIAADTALFGLPEITLGIIPGFGGVPRVVRRVGFARAQWMVLTGDRIDARCALEWGLVHRIVAPELVRPEVEALGRRLANLSRTALASAKAALFASYGAPLEAGLYAEARYFAEAFRHSDRVEGMRAFVERRTALFS